MIIYEHCPILYIYALLDPITSEVRYVGQTKNPRKRLLSHISLARTGRERNHKACWIKGLLSKELEPIQKLLETCEIEIGHNQEDFWIKYYQDKNHRILNTEAPAKTPCLNRPQTDSEVQVNPERQLSRNSKTRAVSYHGVHIHAKNSNVPYRASLRIKTVRHHLGQWDNPEEAARAWDSAMAYYFPDHKIFNFPDSVVPLSIDEIKKTRTALVNQTSLYRGVTLIKKSNLWAVSCSFDNKKTKVGTFDTEEVAAMYRDSLELYYNPDKPKLNFPDKSNKALSIEEVRIISRQLKGLSDTQTSKYPYIFYQKRENKWAFEINKYRKSGFQTELEAARALNTYLTINKINKPILKLQTS